MTYPAARPHDPIEELFPDLFMVRGSIKLNPLMAISRNMGIVRHDGNLTLVNPMRLDEAGERQLRELGDVKRILRLGPMHGIDDPYYVREFGAKLLAQGKSEAYPELEPDVRISSVSELPFPDADLFTIEGAKQMESALLIHRHGGVLFTCDAIQHYGDYRHNNLPARMVMPLIGFRKTTILGPIWLKLMTPEGASLRGEFERLLSYDFDHLLAAHGSFLRGGAHASVAAAIEYAYRSK